MRSCQSSMPNYEMEQHMLVACQHMVKALGATKNFNDDFKRVLAELDSHLSTMTVVTDSEGGRYAEIEERLRLAERIVIRWESSSSLIWDSGAVEASEYLQAVSEIQAVVESLGGLSANGASRMRELANRAHQALQIAMQRLVEELCHLLFQHKQPFEPQCGSFSSRADEVVYDQSFVSLEDEVIEEASTSGGDNNGRECVEYAAELVNPRAIPDIKSIASLMFASEYDKEFCEAFIGMRQEALEEYFSILKVQKASMEEVLKLDWSSWNSEIRKWVCTMRIIIQGYLASERRFCDQILEGFGSISSSCFVEISKASVLRILNYGGALAMGPLKPEKLFRLLDMYEVLSDLHPQMDGLFSEESGSILRIEFHELWKRLGDSARVIFLKFENAIAADASVNAFPGGGIHHLARYVMNYLRTLTGYSDSLNSLFKDQDAEDPDTVLDQNPTACHFRSITATLESNLASKSKLYKDGSLQFIFLLNNIHYMVQKVKNSELRIFFGDEWIRKHNAKFQQHATSYVRTTWNSVVSLLRNDRTSRKERCKRFSNAFDELHRTQTQWIIPDPHLRDDLQISTSQEVILAYRAFLGNNTTIIGEKYIKYTPEDLQELLLDFFIGSTRSLRKSRRF